MEGEALQDAIIRPMGGKPRQMLVVERANGLIYVINPQSKARFDMGETTAVGFPPEDVFMYDRAVLEKVKKAVEIEGSLLRQDWLNLGLEPYRELETEAV